MVLHALKLAKCHKTIKMTWLNRNAMLSFECILNPDHCFKSRSACVLVWRNWDLSWISGEKHTRSVGWSAVRSQEVSVSYLADRWCRLCVGVLDERMRRWWTKKWEKLLLVPKQNYVRDSKYLQNHRQGLAINTKPSSARWKKQT